LFRIAGPLVLLSLEVGILTPLVEFSSGWMATLANPKLFNALSIGTVLFIVLSIPDLMSSQRPRHLKSSMFWLFLNLILYYSLFQFTLGLAAQFKAGEIFWYHATGWLVLVFLNGASAVLIFLSPTSLLIWLQDSWHKAIGALILSINFVILIPEIQKTWHHIHPSTIGLAAEMLESCGRNPTTGMASRHNPILAIQGRGTRLIVTRYCAEMESLAVFLLLATILCLAYLPRIRFIPWLTIVLFGLLLFYFLNAMRIAFLVEIAGSWANPQLAVSLAHSRLSGISFLGISLLLLLASRSWWCPPIAKKELSPENSPQRENERKEKRAVR
jgi:exosortase/archaeosortase family protein